ncbi:hypothetical protein C3495_14565 (plasmid) [Clostridiaceae bacterium 14S0207]|nr:hypothetical protein C3495_14565 [Clostridiaceae bacterium 14S0207]
MIIERKQAKLEDYTMLRVIGILLVILAHATHGYTTGWVYECTVKSDFFRRLTRYVYSFHMPLFLFISGGVYYFCRKTLKKYDNLGGFLLNKSKRLLIPYIFVGCFYLVPIRMYLNICTHPGITYFHALFNQIIRVQIPGGLWYVVMLFNVFILFRIFEKWFDSNPFITNILIFAFLYYRSPKITNQYQISRTCFHIVYFYLGYYFEGHKQQILTYINKLKYPFVTFFITHFICFVFMRKCLRNPYPYFSWRMFNLGFRIMVPVLGIAFCYLGVIHILEKKPNLIHNSKVKFIDKNNFIIYLFHEPIIYLLLSKLYFRNMNSFLVVFICFTVSFTLCCILAFIITKSRILSFLTGNKYKKRSDTI